MKEKAIIIGASTTGKTTLLKYFREHTPLPVSESDDELTERNGGTYPSDSDYKMNQLAPAMVQDVLNRRATIFFSNTHYFTPQDLLDARSKGFTVMQLSLNREIMISRSKWRQENEGYEDHTKYFDGMLKYIDEITEQGLIDRVIDTNRPFPEIAEEISSTLGLK
jgi:adenylate kinase family enzyme